MAGVVEGFEHKDGVWKATWHTPKGLELKVLVIGDAELMKSQSTPIQLQTLMGMVDQHIDRAVTFAGNSEYGDDISLDGGLIVDSVVVSKWDDMKFWFTLPDSDRMVGVRIQQDKTVDVFCDH